MAGDTRDWDKEMAAIDQVIAKGGYVAPSGGGAPAPTGGGGSAPAAPAAAPGGRRAWFGMWIRTLLVLGLAVGLNAWPWSHYCGWRVYWYLTGVGILGLASLWIMAVSWRRRSGLTHILGFLMFGYAVWLGAVEVLPRIGYAQVHRTWSCPAPQPSTIGPQPTAGQQPAANSPQQSGPSVQP